MAKQIQINITSDDSLDEDTIEITVQNVYYLTSAMTNEIQSEVSAIIGLASEQWKSGCASMLHTDKPQAPFGNAIHDNEY